MTDEPKTLRCKCGRLERHLERLGEYAVKNHIVGKIQVSMELVNEKCRCEQTPKEKTRMTLTDDDLKRIEATAKAATCRDVVPLVIFATAAQPSVVQAMAMELRVLRRAIRLMSEDTTDSMEVHFVREATAELEAEDNEQR